MFCNQCEQTAFGTGCVKVGVCGKTADVAELMDVMVYALRSYSAVALKARAKNVRDSEQDHFAVKVLFSTLTNVNFDKVALEDMLLKLIKNKQELAAKAGIALEGDFDNFGVGKSVAELESKALDFDIRKFNADPDITSLMQTVLFGLKGVAAYTDHAAVLGAESEEHYANFYKALYAGFDGKNRDLNDWVGEVLNVGAINVKAMELLDNGNTTTYGHPEPTSVSLKPKAGKAILVTGHDLKDLYQLLQQTAGKGINIYTHGEMLPTHAYPKLKAFEHFAGHFGTAWQNQIKELPKFPGPVLFTTNCIQRPAPSYSDAVFTTGLVGWPGVKHLSNGDFAPVIEKALEMEGFTAESANETAKMYQSESVLTGFAHNTVLGVAGAVVEAVKGGAVKQFFLVGGCDGAKSGRNYYTEFVEKTPADTIVLTLACGKYRFFDKQLGTIGGLPRLMDVGQCNDAFSAVKIAQALAGAFECDINDLPLALILSWYEQKAVAILLSLLYLGFKNMRLGPSLPAFITPNVLNFLVKNYNIAPISTAEEDLAAIMGK
ncbi:hydroxylamine reductase [Desulfovibrio sp. OttesenSCG-928-F07]|nr:hydroxylamine reductase [Desulfovibrio sp. OttesenSCG-928-F07]